MHAALMETPATESYQDVKHLIYYLCRMFNRRFGNAMDEEELIGEANVVFQKVYKTWDPAKGTFTNLLSQCVWRRLTTMNRQRLYRNAACQRSLDEDTGAGPLYDMIPDFIPSALQTEELLEDLSPDALLVASLVICPPAEVATVAEGKGGHAANWRSTIRHYLQDMGWAAARIAESFDEIRSALL